MSSLNEIYESIENPVNNKEFLKKIIAEYSTASRGIYTGAGIYENLVEFNGNNDTSQPNITDMEEFYVKAYNQWKNNLMKMTPQQVEEQKRNGKDIGKLREDLIKFGEIKTLDDVKRLRKSSIIGSNGWEIDGNSWNHIKSQYINVNQEPKIDVKHRLYIGCQNQDLWKMMSLFKTKCEEKGIPYYFKSMSSTKRDDKIVIYSDTENLSNYVDILRIIAKENPEIMSRTGQPPALTGKIDDWIGIADEPPRDENGKNHSFNEIRSKIIEDSIEEELIKSIMSLKGKDVTYEGENIKFNDLFIETATQQLIDKLQNEKDEKLKDKGLTRADLTSEKFKAYFQKQFKNEIQNGLNELWNVRDDKYNRGGSNSDAIFHLPTREGYSVGVSLNDMDRIIKSMLPAIQQLDPQFLDKINKKIQQKAMQKGIDTNTFCFNKGTKEKFEQITGKTIEVKQEVVTQTESNTVTEQIEEKSKKQKWIEGFISAYDITEEEAQKEKRLEFEESDLDRVKEIIETNGLNRMLTSDLEGKLVESSDGTVFKMQYSQKQVSAMARLLKAAEKLTNDRSLNPEGRDYLSEFSNIPDIDYKLKELRDDLKDENSYISELKQRAKEHKQATISKSDIETDVIVEEKSQEQERLNLIKKVSEKVKKIQQYAQIERQIESQNRDDKGDGIRE